MINHHPSAELLFDYAAGSLPEGPALAVASHLSYCGACRADVRRLEALGGAMLDHVDPFDCPVAGDEARLLDQTLARLDEPIPSVPVETAVLDDETRRVVPSPLRRYVGGRLSDLRWRRYGRRIAEARLPLSGSGFSASLLRVQAGTVMPKHGHKGEEYTTVLAGGYSDGGVAFGRGDFDAKEAGDDHRPVADPDGECICLIILDAPVKLTGPGGRLIEPFLRT